MREVLLSKPKWYFDWEEEQQTITVHIRLNWPRYTYVQTQIQTQQKTTKKPPRSTNLKQ